MTPIAPPKKRAQHDDIGRTGQVIDDYLMGWLLYAELQLRTCIGRDPQTRTLERDTTRAADSIGSKIFEPPDVAAALLEAGEPARRKIKQRDQDRHPQPKG